MALHEGAWARVEARSRVAGLALTAWVGLLAEEVAGGLAALTEEQLVQLSAARLGVKRIGSAVNDLARAEHRGSAATEAQLTEVLGRLGERVEAAAAAVQGIGRGVGEVAGEGSGDVAAGPGRGRRGAGPAPRGRVITVWFSPGERALVGSAAAVQGLSAGAWVGALIEDPGAIRPLRGEVWGGVHATRVALRRAVTNLAQIEAVRRRRGDLEAARIGAARGQVEAAIRVCLEVETALYARPRAGVAA